MPRDVIILKNGSTKYDIRESVKVEIELIKETFKISTK